ncbi:MAG: CopG family antitoxin [Dehalococcoidia bacterium]
MPGITNQKTQHPPRFANEIEAGEFWDTHSPEDFPGAFREVRATFDKPFVKRGLTVKLSEETLDELKQRAAGQGIGPSTLARMWILEHLRKPHER